MFGEFFPPIIKSLFIESDIIYHVIEVCENDFYDLFDVMSTFATILNLKLNFFIVTL